MANSDILMYLGRFNSEGKEYVILQQNDDVYYFLCTFDKENNNIDLISEADDEKYLEFDKLFGIGRYIDNNTDEDYREIVKKLKQEYVPISEVNIDEFFNDIIEDKDIPESDNYIFQVIKEELYKFKEELPGMNVASLAKDLNRLKVNFADIEVAAEYDTIEKSLFVNDKLIEKFNEISYDILGEVLAHEIGHMCSNYYDEAKNIDKVGFCISDKNSGITEGFTEAYASMLHKSEPMTYVYNMQVAQMIMNMKDSSMEDEYSTTNHEALYEGIANEDELKRVLGMLDIYTNWLYNRDDSKIKVRDFNIISEMHNAMLNVVKSQTENGIDNINIDYMKNIANAFKELNISMDSLDEYEAKIEEIDLDDYIKIECEYEEFIESLTNRIDAYEEEQEQEEI